jgi:hypothetical protein
MDTPVNAPLQHCEMPQCNELHCQMCHTHLVSGSYSKDRASAVLDVFRATEGLWRVQYCPVNPRHTIDDEEILQQLCGAPTPNIATQYSPVLSP